MSRNRSLDPAIQAVDRLAARVAPPPPPAGLRPGPPRAARSTVLLAAAGLAAAAAALALLWIGYVRPGATPPRQVVVEYLRIGGKPVEPQVWELPAAGAVVITAAPRAARRDVVPSPVGTLAVAGVPAARGRHTETSR